MNETLQLGISQWNQGERSEPKRNGEMPSRRLVPAGDSSPNSEIIAKPKRHRFTASYKYEIVQLSVCKYALPATELSQQLQ